MDGIYNRLTISDDLSADSKVQDRNLLALRDPVVDNPSMNVGASVPLGHSMQHNHALQDYQMQLMLLEQQSKRRISARRGEATDHLVPSTEHNPALQDYETQLILLEQQNRKRLLIARQEQQHNAVRSEKNVDPPTTAGDSAPSRFVAMTEWGDGVDLEMVEMNLRDELAAVDASPLCLQRLQEYIDLMQASSPPIEVIRKAQAPSRHQVLYRVTREDGVRPRLHSRELEDQHSEELEDRYSLPYFDHPEWVRGEGNASRIQCKMPLTNFDLYLEKNKDVAFVVYRNFDSEMNVTAQAGTDDSASEGAVHTPKHTSETIQPVNRDLTEAVKTLLKSRKEYAELLNKFSVSNELQAPYLFIYHSRKGLEEFQDSLPWAAKTQLSLLSNYVMEQYAEEYAAADYLLLHKKISPEYVRYLFKPGDVLVSRVDGQYTGYVATSWPKCSRAKKEPRMQSTTSPNKNPLPLYGSQGSAAGAVVNKATNHVCVTTAWHWEFDGNFQRQQTVLRLKVPVLEDEIRNATNAKKTKSVETKGKEHKPELRGKNISELNVFPIQYASAEIIDKCRRRGKNFWKCRNRCYVSYQDSEVESIQNIVDNPFNYAEG